MNALDNQMKQKLPNSTLVLVLGILSIPTCCIYFGLPSLALAIIALVFYGKDMNLYQANRESYTESSVSNLKGGRICAIIGLVLSAVILLLSLFALSMFGWEALNDPEEMKRILEQYQ